MEQTKQIKTAKVLLAAVLTFVVTLAMVFAILPATTLTAYAAGGTEVTQANVICQQYSYMDAGNYSGGSMYDTPPVEITNITLADAQAFGAAVTCPTTYWVVVYAKDGNNLKWTSNGKTGEQTSTPDSSYSAWCELYNGDVFSFGADPMSDLTFYFSKGLATVGVTGVSLDKTTAQTIDVDGKVSFTATVSPDNATDKTVKWSVGGTDAGAVKLYSDEACTTEVGTGATETLTVYAKGESAGSATVTATSNADSEKKASCDVTVNAAQTQTETLLTTITATSKEQASYSVENIATVAFSYTAQGSSAYYAAWGWWGYGWSATVNAAEGYTITKCVFYDDQDRTATDSEAPFVVETTEEDKTPKVNGTPILAYTSKGIKKIEVYGYASFSVTITAGDHMTKTAGSGEAEQTGLTGAMTDVVYTADDGYYFPTDYSVEAVNGITVTRDSYTQITVSGTPSADAEITLTAPTAKTTPDAPTTAAAVDCTTSDNNDGKLTGVTTNMEYKKSDAENWTAGTGSDITGLVPGTYYVRVKATDTTNASTNQELTINEAQTETLLTTITPTGIDTYSESVEGVVTVTLSNISRYSGGNWAYGGTVSVAPVKGYTITKCRFDARMGYVDDTEAPFSIDVRSAYYVRSIEVYGYATPVASYSVTYNTNGGTINSGNITEYTEGTGATLPTDVTKEGYVFGGWYDNESLTGSSVSEISETDTGDKEYWAMWVESLVGKTYPVDGTGNLVIERATRFADGQGGTATVLSGTYVISFDNLTDSSCLYKLSGYKIYITNDTTKRIKALTIVEGTGLPGNPYVFAFLYDNPISNTVIFSVVNGLWDDGTTADKTVTLTGYEGDTLKLAANQIPAVGTKPSDTYKAGSWDVTPSAETEITAATTYTYTYAQKDSISQTVTFKVANGKWDDDTTADKTVTLTGYEGDTLKLTADQIPAVGTKPNDTYKAGRWDVTPSTDTAITAATTYTYTYAAKEASVVTKAPEAKTLTYNGQAQALVTAGEASGGTMYYAVTTENTAPTDESLYTTPIPTATNAGTYYVWYKVVGDENHNDTNPTCIELTLNKATPSYTAPTDLVVTYGDTLNDVTLTTGWVWNVPTTSVGTVGTHTFAATFTPADTANYNTVEQNLTVTVNANDKTALIAAIGSASEYYNSISSKHPDIAATLQNAIDVATSVKNDDNKTEAEISDAVTALNSALDQAKADENQAKADEVKALITAIGTVEYTTESKGKIDKAKAAYTTLSEAQKALVTNYSELTSAESTYATLQAAAEKAEADQAAANAVKEKIAAIGTVEYNTESKGKIDEAREAYDALTADQKALVDTYETLTTAESTYATLKADNDAANATKALIDAIGTVELTVNSKAVIDLARESYDGLTAEQKALVLNYNVLTAAEVRYADLGAADEAKTLIDAIGDVAYSTESKGKIDAAREAYDALTADQKALVTNYGTLTSAEGNYTDLKAVKEAEDAVSVLPASDDITVTDKAAVAAAKAKYDALTPAQKATVSAETVAKLSAASNMVAAQEVVVSIGNIDADNPDSAKVTEARAAYDALTDEQKAKVTNYESLTAAESKLIEINNPEKKGLSGGAIAGIVIAVVVVLIGAVLLVLWLLKKKGRDKGDDNDGNDANNDGLSGSEDTKIENDTVSVEKEVASSSETLPLGSATTEEEAEEEDVVVVDEKGNYFNIRYNKSFTAKLIQSPETTQSYYTALKNEVSAYSKTKSRVSWAYDSINAGRAPVLKFNVRGKTLCVYFALNADDYANSKYKVEKVESSKYESVPCMYRIKNDRRLGYAKDLIAATCEKLGLTKGDVPTEDYRLPYEPTEVLLAKGLVKELKTAASVAQIDRARVSGKIPRVEQVSVQEANALISDEVAATMIEGRTGGAVGKKEIINVDVLSKNYADGDTVTLDNLKAKKLVPQSAKQVKLLARGTLDKVLHVELQDYSPEAVKMVIATGGTVKRV